MRRPSTPAHPRPELDRVTGLKRSAAMPRLVDISDASRAIELKAELEDLKAELAKSREGAQQRDAPVCDLHGILLWECMEIQSDL